MGSKSRQIKIGGMVFRDPVHQLIRIAPGDEVIVDLIDTPEFQRLRRIRQLGVSWMTYHGAEHSRFTHSLGVFHLTQRIIEALERRYPPDGEVHDALQAHKRTVKVAALLHDIGHAPFSHLLERAFESSPHHEAVTIKLIKSEETSIGKVLRSHGIDIEAVAAIIGKTFTPKFLVDIVSSQLDADRMDYLLRDSLSTGVSYGHYDVEWLLHAMCVARVDLEDDPTHNNLCLDKSKGVFAAERFVMARMQMYQQVYLHRVTRGYEMLLLNLFKAATYATANGGLPPGTPALVEAYFRKSGNLDTAEWIAFDETQMFAAFHSWSVADHQRFATLQRLSRAFLERRGLYGAVDITQLHSKMRETLKLNELLKAAAPEADGRTPRYGIDYASDTPYKGIAYRAPKAGISEESIAESILVADAQRTGPAVPIEVHSHVLKNLDAANFDVDRLYYDKEHEAEFVEILKNVGIDIARESQP